jgi:hypothetical protein
MYAILQALVQYVRGVGRDSIQGWDRFWFNPVDPTTVAIIRIFTGALVFYIHITTLGELLNLIGPEAWIDAQAIRDVRSLPSTMDDPTQRYLSTWYGESIWFYIQDPQAMFIIQGIFLAATACFTLGLCSRTTSVIVWIGHISYVQRGFVIWFGMDSVLAMLLLYLIFAPTGATLSLDRLLERYRTARRALNGSGGLRAPELALQPRWSANVVMRLIQIHMCVIYLFAGLSKLQGDRWWGGSAAWYTMMVPELEIMSMRWLAFAPQWLYMLIVLGSTYFTLAFEVSFPFVVWNRFLRPLVLLSAVGLHLGIGFFMGLGGFGAAMLTGCTAFTNPATWSWLLAALFKGKGGLRFAYDRHLPGTLSAAGWIAAADPYGQVVLENAPDRAGQLTTRDGRQLSGSDAVLHLLGTLRCFPFVAPVALWFFQPVRTEVLQKV